jgi:uracil-DNA glycosylase
MDIASLEEDILDFKSEFNRVKGIVYSDTIPTDIEVLPKKEYLLNFLDHLSFKDIRVVILGQEPYATPELSDGRAFSIGSGKPIPPILLNVFKELKSSLGYEIPESGSLEGWTRQGVVLLNRVLTVAAGRPRSHVEAGWIEVSDRLISIISQYHTNVVFLLWGTQASKVTKLIDGKKHLILKASYPSPLAATKGFFGCDHFRKANEYLRYHGRGSVNWRI